jgi:hypothetical protein
MMRVASIEVTLRSADGYEVGYLPGDVERLPGGRGARAGLSAEVLIRQARFPFELTWSRALPVGSHQGALLTVAVRALEPPASFVFEVPVEVHVAEARGAVAPRVTAAFCRAIADDALRQLASGGGPEHIVREAIAFVRGRGGLAGVDVRPYLDELYAAAEAIAARPRPARTAELLRCWVAGSRYYTEAIFAERLFTGMPLRLVREPDNAYDPRAIAVCAESGAKLGYVPRAKNFGPASLMDAGFELRAVLADLGVDGWKQLEIIVSLVDEV